MAFEIPAGPQPTTAIGWLYDSHVYGALEKSIEGSRICGIRIFSKFRTANSWRPEMLIAPSSEASRLQPPTQRSDVGQTMPQESPSGLSLRMVFAAP